MLHHHILYQLLGLFLLRDDRLLGVEYLSSVIEEIHGGLLVHFWRGPVGGGIVDKEISQAA
jgi:hypothetical protein